jgi:uncharacterized membrane protein YkvA (DUF1232 family)
LVGRFPEASSDSCVGTFLIGTRIFILALFFLGCCLGVQRAARIPFERSKKIVRLFKRELIVISACCRMIAPPSSAKLLRALATDHLCMAFDLIPDFIPRIGHLDDAVIIPALVFAALRFVPRELERFQREHILHHKCGLQRHVNGCCA